MVLVKVSVMFSDGNAFARTPGQRLCYIVLCACEIYKVQNLVHRDYSKHARTRSGTHEHTGYTKLNLHNLKQAANRDLRRMKAAAQNGKRGRSIVSGNETF